MDKERDGVLFPNALYCHECNILLTFFNILFLADCFLLVGGKGGWDVGKWDISLKHIHGDGRHSIM